MHLSWFMNLFIILILFNVFLSSKGFINFDDSEENDLFDSSSTTPESFFIDHTKGPYDDHHHEDEEEEEGIVETTTSFKKTTKDHDFLDDDEHHDHDVYEDDSEESTSTTTPATTKSILTTNIIISQTTSTTQTTNPSTDSNFSASTRFYDIYPDDLWIRSTLSPEQISAYLAKTNRDRFILKTFTITVIIGMSILAVVLITIHFLQKSRRYHGYKVPTNTSPNPQSNQIYI